MVTSHEKGGKFGLLCILATMSFHGDVSRSDDVSEEVQTIVAGSYHVSMLVTSTGVECSG